MAKYVNWHGAGHDTTDHVFAAQVRAALSRFPSLFEEGWGGPPPLGEYLSCMTGVETHHYGISVDGCIRGVEQWVAVEGDSAAPPVVNTVVLRPREGDVKLVITYDWRKREGSITEVEKDVPVPTRALLRDILRKIGQEWAASRVEKFLVAVYKNCSLPYKIIPWGRGRKGGDVWGEILSAAYGASAVDEYDVMTTLVGDAIRYSDNRVVWVPASALAGLPGGEGFVRVPETPEEALKPEPVW